MSIQKTGMLDYHLRNDYPVVKTSKMLKERLDSLVMPPTPNGEGYISKLDAAMRNPNSSQAMQRMLARIDVTA